MAVSHVIVVVVAIVANVERTRGDVQPTCFVGRDVQNMIESI